MTTHRYLDRGKRKELQPKRIHRHWSMRAQAATLNASTLSQLPPRSLGLRWGQGNQQEPKARAASQAQARETPRPKVQGSTLLQVGRSHDSWPRRVLGQPLAAGGGRHRGGPMLHENVYMFTEGARDASRQVRTSPNASPPSPGIEFHPKGEDVKVI